MRGSGRQSRKWKAESGKMCGSRGERVDEDSRLALTEGLRIGDYSGEAIQVWDTAPQHERDCAMRVACFMMRLMNAPTGFFRQCCGAVQMFVLPLLMVFFLCPCGSIYIAVMRLTESVNCRRGGLCFGVTVVHPDKPAGARWINAVGGDQIDQACYKARDATAKQKVEGARYEGGWQCRVGDGDGAGASFRPSSSRKECHH